jgi:hypothetical protein
VNCFRERYEQALAHTGDAVEQFYAALPPPIMFRSPSRCPGLVHGLRPMLPWVKPFRHEGSHNLRFLRRGDPPY